MLVYGLGRVGGWALTQYHLQQAAGMLRDREFTAALGPLGRARWSAASDPDVWLLSARTARRAGQLDHAAEWLQTAEARGARPRAVQIERLLLRVQQGRWSEEAEEALHALLRTTRTDYSVVAEVLTGEYMRLYRFPDARKVLDRWVELFPADVEAWLRRGWVGEHQLAFDAAVADYRQALALDPIRDPVRVRLAELLLKLRRPAEAVTELDAIRDPAAHGATVPLLRARCFRELGQPDRAAEALDTLAGDDNQLPRAVAERGQIAMARGAFAAAEPLLRQALTGLPRDRELIYVLQQSLSRQGKTRDAETVARTLAEVDADGRRIRDLLARIDREPADAGLRYEVAGVFLRNGVPDDAVRWLRLTLELDPAHRAAHERLAECYERQGQAERAATHRAAARRLAESPAR
ncbi:MAG: tetratricopeptide repeat protein [Gemmataceae bacterium]